MLQMTVQGEHGNVNDNGGDAEVAVDGANAATDAFKCGQQPDAAGGQQDGSGVGQCRYCRHGRPASTWRRRAAWQHCQQRDPGDGRYPDDAGNSDTCRHCDGGGGSSNSSSSSASVSGESEPAEGAAASADGLAVLLNNDAPAAILQRHRRQQAELARLALFPQAARSAAEGVPTGLPPWLKCLGAVLAARALQLWDKLCNTPAATVQLAVLLVWELWKHLQGRLPGGLPGSTKLGRLEEN